MLLRKKGQSTAEYAILLGVVVAVAAGILQVALKGGMRQKNKQALDYMVTAGDTDIPTAANAKADLYSQEYRQTTVKKADYVDKSVLEKGGAEKKQQKQTTETESISLETINAAGTTE